ncbi:protease inhibitor I42 family protein [Streptomyces odontomachi]|uniref:protease inhibitor I42 family protein n=1 Tax=Streptomyces odontomachi TaxID=2944940 RepID=UPI00210BFFF8|nr:protease inhibitor I42 family protein [Streptomyces sp. ODS25]
MPLAAVAAAVALLPLATGCGADSPHSYSTSETRISAEVGETFTLTVDENPSTGEEWYVAAPKPDGSVVRGVSDRYDADDDSKDLIGGGGTHTFTFKATGVGHAKIVLLDCPVHTCTGQPNSPTPAPPSPSAYRPATPERITYTVTVR